MGRLDPLVKWSGSKRSQAAAILASVKGSYNTYYEPFCGGCSVLFYILNNCPDKFKHYVCSDLNAPLIELYRLVAKFGKDGNGVASAHSAFFTFC